MTSKKPMRVIFTRPSEIITRLSRIPTAKSRFGDSKQFNTHVPCRTLLRLSPSVSFTVLRNKEPELAEKIDSSFGCFDLGFYRVNFVFGSRHLIIVSGTLLLSKKRHLNKNIRINVRKLLPNDNKYFNGL